MYNKVKVDDKGNIIFKYKPLEKKKKKKKIVYNQKFYYKDKLYKNVIDYRQSILHLKFNVNNPKKKINYNVKKYSFKNIIKINGIKIDIDKLIIEFNSLINIPNIYLYISNPSFNKKVESKFDKIYSFLTTNNNSKNYNNKKDHQKDDKKEENLDNNNIKKDSDNKNNKKKSEDNNDNIKNHRCYNYIELISIINEIWQEKLANKTKQLFLEFKEEFNFENLKYITNVNKLDKLKSNRNDIILRNLKIDKDTLRGLRMYPKLNLNETYNEKKNKIYINKKFIEHMIIRYKEHDNILCENEEYLNILDEIIKNELIKESLESLNYIYTTYDRAILRIYNFNFIKKEKITANELCCRYLSRKIFLISLTYKELQISITENIFIRKKKDKKYLKNLYKSMKRQKSSFDSSYEEEEEQIKKYNNIKLCKTDNFSFLNPSCDYITKYEVNLKVFFNLIGQIIQENEKYYNEKRKNYVKNISLCPQIKLNFLKHNESHKTNNNKIYNLDNTIKFDNKNITSVIELDNKTKKVKLDHKNNQMVNNKIEIIKENKDNKNKLQLIKDKIYSNIHIIKLQNKEEELNDNKIEYIYYIDTNNKNIKDKEKNINENQSNNIYTIIINVKELNKKKIYSNIYKILSTNYKNFLKVNIYDNLFYIKINIPKIKIKFNNIKSEHDIDELYLNNYNNIKQFKKNDDDFEIYKNFKQLLSNQYIIKLKGSKSNRNYITSLLNCILLYFYELYKKIQTNISTSFENKKIYMEEITKNQLYDFITINYKINLSIKYIDDYLKIIKKEKGFEIFKITSN